MHRTGSESIARTRLKESKDLKYYIIILTFIFLIVGTKIHDPLLHGLVIWFNGWDFGSYQSGILTGSTDALIAAANTQEIPTFNLYLFYMFPASAIYIMVIKNQQKITLILANVLMIINLASFSTEVVGSDGYKAATWLTEKGWGQFEAFGLQTLIFYIVVAIWALLMYVAIENNSKDAKRRLKEIIG